MLHPPSLASDVITRAFVAANGELGILPADVCDFLHACRKDGIEVFGWELWIVDHETGDDFMPVPARGVWHGGIPVKDSNMPAVISGNGSADDCKRQLAKFNFAAKIRSAWMRYVRVNFTLDG